MQAPSRDTAEALDAFGAPRHATWRVWIRRRHWASRAVLAVVVASWLLLIALAFISGRALFHAGSTYPSCAAAGISSPQGREGICARGSTLFGTLTLYNVVDRSHLLKMPEYEASLGAAEVIPTRVRTNSENDDRYPDGRGQLVSFQITITNTGKKPLAFGGGTRYSPIVYYLSHPIVELALPESAGTDIDSTFSPIINGNGAPAPSLFERPPIAPGSRISGWVSFVAPPWAARALHLRPADMDFLRADASSHYVGQIRLWK